MRAQNFQNCRQLYELAVVFREKVGRTHIDDQMRKLKPSPGQPCLELDIGVQGGGKGFKPEV